MSSNLEATTHTFDQALAGLPSCALDDAGVERQRTRYASLARSVTGLEREPEAVVIEFCADFDRKTLERALSVERGCCPFFQFAFEDSQQRLRVTVKEAEQLPALDAIADAFGAVHRSTPRDC